MDYLSAGIYGVIQGLTEFIPVSSSGHLAILPYVLHTTDPGISFDLAMHVGTVASIVCYFKRDIFDLLRELSLFILRKDGGPKRNFTLYFCFATMITAFLALALKGPAESFGRSPHLIAFNLLFFGAIMYFADRFCEESPGELMARDHQWKKAFFIGVAQTIALFPGVSRSGITITAGRAFKLSRKEASRFSFLLSAPLIVAGFIMKLPGLVHGDVPFEWGPLLFGLFVSFVTGVATIHFFLKLIQKLGLGFFFVYRIILGVSILLIL